MEACKRSRKVEDEEDALLDASIWGHLQDYIDLEAICTKLPRSELLRLRLVCKSWNQAADQTLEPRPFFPIIARGCDYRNYEIINVGDEYLNGVLSYDTVSQNYSFKRQPFAIPEVPSCCPFAVEGLIFCHHPENLSEAGVFNIHTLTWHSIPDVSEHRCVVGMMVDTSVRPHSFKLVVGSLVENTRIYDSRTRAWSVMSSRLQQAAKYALNHYEIINCMSVNNSVWISVGAEMLLVYSMERDAWRIVDSPEVECAEEYDMHAVGAWDGRIFTAREDTNEGRVTVWELVDEAKAEWAEYVVISGSDYSILGECDFGMYGPSIYEELRVLPCFCDGYLLLYNWHYSNCRSYARGMLNLATCEWEKVTLPPRTVAFEKNTEEDGVRRDIFEEDSEEDRGYGSRDSGHGFARRAIRIRREKSRAKVNIRPSTEADKTEVRGVAHGCDIAPQAEKLPASMTGKMVARPSSVLASIGAKAAAGAPSARKPPKVAQPSPVYKKPVTFCCAMCFFESDVQDEYEGHKRTKTHGIIEELQRQKNKHAANPLCILNNYVTSNRLQVNYEFKSGEMTATVKPRGSAGDSHVKGVARHGKQKKAKHMAAAAVLEKIIETYDPEFKFAKLLHKIGLRNWDLGNRDPKNGGNKGGSSNEGNDGGSSIGVVGCKEGNIGGNVGSTSSQGVGAAVGGKSGGNVDNVVGNPNGSGGSGSSGSRGGGGGKAGSSCEGVGNNLSNNPNAIPVPGYNKYTSSAGSRGNIDMEKNDGTNQVEVPTSRPKVHNEKKSEKLAESGIQGGKGGVKPKPARALGHSSHPGISAYGQQPRGPIDGGHAQCMPNPVMVTRTHHYISTETFYTQQAAPWVGGPGQGGISYPLYGMAPGVSPGTMVQTHTRQYAPPINYGAYGPYEGFAVSTVQEMAPGTSTSARPTSVAQYGMMQQPQRQVPQQHPGYPLQPGDVPSFFASDHIF